MAYKIPNKKIIILSQLILEGGKIIGFIYVNILKRHKYDG